MHVDPWIPWLPNYVPKIKENLDDSQWTSVADLRLANGLDWDRELIRDICDQASAEAIFRIVWSLQTCGDRLLWLGEGAKSFSVKGCYKEVIKNRVGSNFNRFWRKHWQCSLHERLKHHLWRMSVNILPTSDLITQRTGAGDTSCSFCGAGVESSVPIYKECHLGRLIGFGSRWGFHLDNWEWDTIQDLVLSLLEPSNGTLVEGMDKSEFLNFGATLFYTIWSGRCKFFFDGGVNLHRLINRFNCSVEEFTEAGKKEGMSSSSSEDQDLINWRPPQQGFLKVNVDAAFANRNAAAAMVVRDDCGNVLVLASKLFTCSSAFDAEVEALEWASFHADSCGWRKVDWETDAKEVANFIKSTEEAYGWYSYHSLNAIRKRFAFQDWQLSWKSRLSNTLADLVAKYSLSFNCGFNIDEFSLHELPFCILEKVMVEQAFTAM